MGYVYKDMERLRFWCQKVLPTVYDDSLSYYELLTKVVQYINDTVENVNTLIQQVADIDTDLSRVAIIDDNVISADYTWSSQKSNSMMNSKITDAIRNTSAPNNTGNTYSCKYITDHFSNVIEGITVNGSTVSPDAQKVVNLVVMTNAVNDLVYYYLKSETYSKVEVNTLLENIRNSSFEVVDSLPVSDIKTNVIYLVPKGSGRTGYYEWVYINVSGTYQWEEIGDTDIDLSGYVTDGELATALSNYVTTQALNTALASYVTSSTFNALVARVSTVEGIIPSGASSSNQLVDSATLTNGLSGKFPRDEQRLLGTMNLNGTPYTSGTNHGISFVANSDGTVSVSGTSDAQTEIPHSYFVAPFSAQVILSGGINDSIYIYPWDATESARPYTDSSLTTRQTNNAGLSEISFWMEEGHRYSMIPRVNRGVVISETQVFKPMLRLASDPDNTYAPYAMTNRELTVKVFEKNILTSADDLNDIHTTGIYGVTTSPANAPDNKEYATLIVKQVTSTLTHQIFIRPDTIYTRRYDYNQATPWGNWFKFTGTMIS